MFRVSEQTIKPIAEASRAKLIAAKAEEKPKKEAPQLSGRKEPGG